MSTLFGVPLGKLLGAVLFGSLLAEAGFYVCGWFSRRRRGKNDEEYPYYRTIFFPDSQVACRTQFTQRYGCTDQRCKFSHDPDSSYGQLLRAITSAKESLSLCIFTITSADLANALVDMHHRGVVVRVITDSEHGEATGSQIIKFRSEGIQVRKGGSSYFMHHKFALVDGKHLINGSFNWTHSAITWNNENLLLTNHPQLVESYLLEFEKLWILYEPKIPNS